MKKGTIETDGDITFGNPFYVNTDNVQPLEERQFETTINGIKTTIVCKFLHGFLTTFSSTSEKVKESKPTKAKQAKERFIKKEAKDRFIKRRG